MRRYGFNAVNPRQSRGLSTRQAMNAAGGFTLVEMLVAIGITIVMMLAVVTLFANVSGSVRNRRATIEMSGQLRHVRNMLQQDLQGATCPGLTWQRPESNHGYIELVEGPAREGNASILIDADPSASPARNWPPTPLNPEINHETSILPSSNMPFANTPERARWVTDGGGLGDYDDILMLTVRNEHEPFVGRVPSNVRLNQNSANGFEAWEYATMESTLAEVVWYSVENPGYTDASFTDPSAEGFFGQPGMRTIYRRALLIAPWVNPYSYVDNRNIEHNTFNLAGERDRFVARPGLVRILRDDIDLGDLNQALASLVAFQERYDLSVRLEWDPNLGGDGRYKIVANTLGDLTKRENRYEHHSYRPTTGGRDYPFAVASAGSGYGGTKPAVICWPDLESPQGPPPVPDYLTPPPPYTEGRAELISGSVGAYSLAVPVPPPPNERKQIYKWRPFAYIDEASDTLATARVILNDKEEVVRIIHGLVPLSNERRGEDVMMTDVLAFDLRVYDPGAPLFLHMPTDTALEPADPGWAAAYLSDDNMKTDGTGAIGARNSSSNVVFPFVGQGAYVDLAYGYDSRSSTPNLPAPRFASPTFSSSTTPWFFTPRALSDVFGRQLAPGYAVYDTWSFHYENNGVNEDNDEVLAGMWRERNPPDPNGIPSIDEGTNGLEDFGHYSDKMADIRLGVDDVGERETVPPYDKPLRGIQVMMRAYERDSRAIRQVRVNQHFMPE